MWHVGIIFIEKEVKTYKTKQNDFSSLTGLPARIENPKNPIWRFIFKMAGFSQVGFFWGNDTFLYSHTPTIFPRLNNIIVNVWCTFVNTSKVGSFDMCWPFRIIFKVTVGLFANILYDSERAWDALQLLFSDIFRFF